MKVFLNKNIFSLLFCEASIINFSPLGNEISTYLNDVKPASILKGLSTPALETLAIIAYEQPVTKLKISIDSVSFKKSATFKTALCSIFEVTIVLTPRSLTAETKTILSDSVPQEVKYIS